MANKEVVTKWVEALESGEFKQGASMLRIAPNEEQASYCYCCLGVLCELYRREHPGTSEWEGSTFTVQKSDGTGLREIDPYGLPKSVQEWAQIHDSDPILDGETETTAAGANDKTDNAGNHVNDFKAIARMIRERFIYGEDPNEIRN